MASIDIDEVTYEKIRARAASKHRSLEAELGDILRDALVPGERANSLRRIADELAAKVNAGVVPQSDSVELLREDRDR